MNVIWMLAHCWHAHDQTGASLLEVTALVGLGVIGVAVGGLLVWLWQARQEKSRKEGES